MKVNKIAIIGCGNLGTSILNGLIYSEYYSNKSITATRRNVLSLEKYQNEGVHITADNAEAVQQADILLIGLKPFKILEVLAELKPHLTKDKILVSLATGITISQIEEVVGAGMSVYRAMPNTAADVKESLTCICANHAISETDEVTEIFNSVGKSIVIEEGLMEAATVLGACGIAYVLRFIRGMIQGGIEIGFSAKVATDIVTQTVKGASELLIQNETHPEAEIDKVTTPRGCTIAGLNEMEHNGFSSALIKGIVTSYEKI
ncbi:MAG TPA: pyrroline-5-carboxylate reductase [Flavobacteriales bacterium]|nr:pyrroline-5-carboxylate reductase [Flavobacteriales bacterium]|tara:strand:- start:4530 stop:5315 length:786 start_codon:yes stop_codon:yes gene_type:complete